MTSGCPPRLRKRGWLLLLTLAAVSFVSTGSLEARRKKKIQPSPTVPYRIVAVVPPRVSITRDRILGGVAKVETSLEVEDLLVQATEDRLEQIGFEVSRGALRRQVLEGDPELQLAVSTLQDRFDESFGQVLSARTPLEDIESGRFNLGDPALLVAWILGVEGLVFVRGQGVSTGGGTKAAYFFMTLGGGIPGSGIRILIGGVDGRTGTLHDLSAGSSGGPILKKTEKIVTRALQGAMRDLRPPAAGPRQAQPRPPQDSAPETSGSEEGSGGVSEATSTPDEERPARGIPADTDSGEGVPAVSEVSELAVEIERGVPVVRFVPAGAEDELKVRVVGSTGRVFLVARTGLCIHRGGSPSEVVALAEEWAAETGGSPAQILYDPGEEGFHVEISGSRGPLRAQFEGPGCVFPPLPAEDTARD